MGLSFGSPEPARKSKTVVIAKSKSVSKSKVNPFAAKKPFLKTLVATPSKFAILPARRKGTLYKAKT